MNWKEVICRKDITNTSIDIYIDMLIVMMSLLPSDNTVYFNGRI